MTDELAAALAALTPEQRSRYSLAMARAIAAAIDDLKVQGRAILAAQEAERKEAETREDMKSAGVFASPSA